MELSKSLQERLERVLGLAERWLRDSVDDERMAESFERHVAFRWDADRARGAGRLVAIERPAVFDLGDLVGVDAAVAAFVQNIEQFLAGHGRLTQAEATQITNALARHLMDSGAQ